MNHTIDHSKMLGRYIELRDIRDRLRQEILETVPHSVLQEIGKSLGLYKRNRKKKHFEGHKREIERKFVFDTGSEGILLTDYTIHNCYRNRVSIVEDFLNECAYADNSDERILLKVLVEARYTIVKVMGITKGIGLFVEDFEANQFFLMDIGLSKCVSKGNFLATRIISLDSMQMTTGAALPFFDQESLDKVFKIYETYLDDFTLDKITQLSPTTKSKIERRIILLGLQNGAVNFITSQY